MSDRNRQRLRTIITVVVTALVIAPAAALATHGFTDVDNGDFFHTAVDWMKDNDVTAGCNPPSNTRYCPDDFVTRGQMAVFLERLDSKDVFLRPGEKAADADLLDGKNSTAFLGAGQKAADAEKLDGKDSSAFAASGHKHLGQTWTGSGSGLRVRTDATGDHDAPIAGINTGAATTSALPFGVYGEVGSSNICTSCSGPSDSAGVLGRNTGGGHGVVGHAGTNTSLWKPVGEVGVVGLGDSRGLYGSGGSLYGAYVTSLNWYGLYARTSRIDENYGIYTPDNLFAKNVTSSSTTTVMQNGSTDALEPGDVVVFSGMGTADGTPVPAVSRSSTAGDPAVAGVVLSAFDPQAAALDPDDPDSTGAASDPTPDGAIDPGAYVLVTVLGPVQVNVAEGEVAGLQPGDLVTTSAAAGTATDLAGTTEAGTATELAGSVLGKVLGPSNDASDKVWVFVTLR